MADGYNFDKKTSLGDTMNSLLSRQDALIRQKQKQGKLGTMEKVMGLLGILSIVDGIQTKSASIKTRNALTSPEMLNAEAKADFLKLAPQSQLVVDYGSYYNPNDKTGSINDITKAYIGKTDPSMFAGTGFDPKKFSFEDLDDNSQTTLLNKFQPTATAIYNSIDSTGGQAMLEPYKAGRQERQKQFVSYEENRNNFLERITNKVTGNQSLFKDSATTNDFLKGKLIYNEDKSSLIENPNWIEGGIEYSYNKFVKPNRIGMVPDLSDAGLTLKPQMTSERFMKTSYRITEDGSIEAYDTPYIRSVGTDRLSGQMIPKSYKEERVPGFVGTVNEEQTLNATTARMNIRKTLGTAGEKVFEREINAGEDNLVKIMAIAANEVKPLGTGQYVDLKEFDGEIRNLYNALTSNLTTGALANLSPKDTLKYTDISFGDELKGDLASYVTAPYETFKALQYQQAWVEGRLDESVGQFIEFFNEGENKYGLMTDKETGKNIINPKFDVTAITEGKQYIVNEAGLKEAVIQPEQLGIYSKLKDSQVLSYFRGVTGRAPQDGDVFPANFEELNIIPWEWNDKRKEWVKPTTAK